MAYDKVVDSTVLEDGLTQIADAIREKGNLGDPLMSPLTFPSGFVGAIEGLSVGIKATAGTFTVADTTRNYVLSHGLGEVPVLFFIGIDRSYQDVPNSSTFWINAYGFGSKSTQYSMTGYKYGSDITAKYQAKNITESSNGLALSQANASSITIAATTEWHYLTPGVPYYWIAVGSGVFSE